MVTTVLVLWIIGYGIKRLAGYAKNNPSQSMQAAQWLRRMLGK